MNTFKPLRGGHQERRPLPGSARNAYDVCHAIGHVQSGLGVLAFKYWRLYSPASPFSSTLSRGSNLNQSFTLKSVLEAPTSSSAVHRRFACMGCTTRSNGRGELCSGGVQRPQLSWLNPMISCHIYIIDMIWSIISDYDTIVYIITSDSIANIIPMKSGTLQYPGPWPAFAGQPDLSCICIAQ
jgi:hypothetical protein